MENYDKLTNDAAAEVFAPTGRRRPRQSRGLSGTAGVSPPDWPSKDFRMEQKLKIAVFIDFDNIEIGVKSTLHREFDVSAGVGAPTKNRAVVPQISLTKLGPPGTAHPPLF